MTQTDPRWFIKSRITGDNLHVYVILDHSVDPDRLSALEYWVNKEDAERQAKLIRERTGCMPAAIEVVELKFMCEGAMDE